MPRKASARQLAPLLVLAACASASAEDDMDGFKRWAATAPIAEFEAYLARSGLNGVVPTRQLLRTATDWKNCGGPAFEVPPREQWPEVTQVLALVSALKSRKILADFEAVSSYRNPILNACSGGAARSSHTRTFAVDILPRDGQLDENRLCEFWRSDGKAWEMGLSKYPSGRIHLDTSGYRTWGADHTKATSFCKGP
jgi:hypothetical protein